MDIRNQLNKSIFTICCAIGLFSHSVKANTDDWSRYYIGAYSVERFSKQVEIAFWQQRGPIGDLHKYAKMRFGALIRAKDGSCLFSTQHIFNFPRYGFFNGEMALDLLGKTEAYGIFVSGFDDLQSDEEYMNQPAPVRHLPNGAPNPVFKAYRDELYEKQNQCRRTIGKGFHLFQDSLAGQLYFGDRGRMNKPENVRPVNRAKVSPELLSMINQKIEQSVKRNGVDLVWPNAEALKAMKDPNYIASIENTLSARCMQRGIDARYQLFTKGIYQLSARLIDDKKVLVKTIKIPDKPLASGEKHPFTETLYKRNTNVDWENLIFTTPERAFAQAHCDAADSIYQFLAALENNSLEKLELNADLSEQTFDLNDHYIISANGLMYVNPEKLGNGTAVIHQSPHFSEGDLVYFIEKGPGFRLGLRSWMKNPLNDKFDNDYNMPIEYAALSVNAELSAKYNTEVSAGKLKVFGEPLCTVYAGVKKATRCIESIPVNQRRQQVYVVKTSKEKATAIFRDLFPNFVQPKQPDCSSLPFCKNNTNFQSDYLNAVYLQDIKTVKELDKTILKQTQKSMNNLFSDFLDEDQEIHVSIIPYLLNEYIYAYQNQPMQCFQAGSRPMVFRDYVPETSLVDGYGFKVWSAGGYSRETTYKMVDADFVEACNEVCGIREAAITREFINVFFNGSYANNINADMQKFLKQHQCDSPEVNKFEEGLLSAYQFLSVPLEQTNRFYRSYY